MAPPANPVPKNVAAAIGLVPTVLGGVRRLPSKAVQLPVIAVGTALNGLETARREYDDLADRGERLIARLRGASLDNGALANAGEAVQEVTEHAKDRVEAEHAVQEVQAAAQPEPLPFEAQPAAQSTAQQAAEETPKPSTARVDSAATPDVVEQVEKIAGNVAAPLITDHSELPLPDYDHMTLGSLRGRLRSLDMQQLVQLRDYEKSKADRLPVVTMLDNRIAKLSNGESTPTGTTQDTPSAKASTDNKPPKAIGTKAEAKTASTPPHGKVRLT